jgi:hypothetical protein
MPGGKVMTEAEIVGLLVFLWASALFMCAANHVTLIVRIGEIKRLVLNQKSKFPPNSEIMRCAACGWLAFVESGTRARTVAAKEKFFCAECRKEKSWKV